MYDFKFSFLFSTFHILLCDYKVTLLAIATFSNVGNMLKESKMHEYISIYIYISEVLDSVAKIVCGLGFV